MLFVILPALLCAGRPCDAQDLPASTAGRSNHRQVQLTVDNDAYFFTAYDRYYTSGIFASYGTLMEQPLIGRNEGGKGTKYTSEIWFSHYIYTPRNILWQQEEQLDRPYAGLATLGGRTGYLKERQSLTLQAHLGWLGPAIKTAELHRWWHRTLNIREPRGWQYEINDSPALVLGSDFTRRWKVGRRADILTTTGIMTGTIFNRISQGITARVGRPAPLNRSHFTNGLVGERGGDRKLLEWYLIARLQLTYVVYDATIDGNLIGDESTFTKESEPWVLRHTYGVVVAAPRADFELSFKLTSTEVEGAEQHRYMRAKVSYRF